MKLLSCTSLLYFNNKIVIIIVTNDIAQKIKFPTDLITFTEKIPNGKLHLLCSVK